MLREVLACSGKICCKFAKSTNTIAVCAFRFNKTFVRGKVEVVVTIWEMYALCDDDFFVPHFRVGVGVLLVVVNCPKKNLRFTKA